MRTMPKTPRRLRVPIQGKPLGVDRENMVLRGYVVAQRGYFKTEGRGQFTDESLAKIIQQMNTKKLGTKSRFAHPDMSNDGLGTFLGRARNARLDGDRIRADLHFDPSAFATPKGDLAGYVLRLAESDPDALSSSLVVDTEKTYQLDEKGNPKIDEEGNELPPVWLPTKIYASDIVDEGDAVDGLLSAGVEVDRLRLSELWHGAEMLDRLFAGQSRDVVEARLLGFLERYLTRRYGPLPPKPESACDRLIREQRQKLWEQIGK